MDAFYDRLGKIVFGKGYSDKDVSPTVEEVKSRYGEDTAELYCRSLERELTSVDIATASRAVLNTLAAEDTSDAEEFDFEKTEEAVTTSGNSSAVAAVSNASATPVSTTAVSSSANEEQEANVSPASKRRKTTNGKAKPVLINDPL